MELVLILDAAPAAVVLSAGLLVLVRRRVALGRRATVAIAGVSVLLVGALARTVLGVFAYRAISAGAFGLAGWMEVTDVLLLPADLLGLPLLAWAVLSDRGPRAEAAPR
jgi:hypothetical protein